MSAHQLRCTNRCSEVGARVEISDEFERRKAMATLEAIDGWGGSSNPGSYREVSDVAVDGEGNVYAFTRRPSKVVVYSSNGAFVREWGAGRFLGRAHGITVAPDGTIFCVDDLACSIQRFTPEGDELGTFGPSGVPSDTGAPWDAPDTAVRLSLVRIEGGPPFNRPTKVAFGVEGDVFVSDGYGNCKVHHFTPSGELIGSWGVSGTGPGAFHLPHSVAVAPDGKVIVVDRENDRLQLFQPDGRYLATWNGFHRPVAVTIDSAGLIFVAELPIVVGHPSFIGGPAKQPFPARLSVLDSSGDRIATYGDEGGLGVTGRITNPHGIAVDTAGNIYVAETVAGLNRKLPPNEEPLPSIIKYISTRGTHQTTVPLR